MILIEMVNNIFINKYKDVKPYVTKDGSIIRELMHPGHHPARNQSVAEAIVQPGMATLAHMHLQTEEIYHVTSGSGRMGLDDKEFKVRTGDTIVIRPGVVHHLVNDGEEDLKVLCCCSPPYSHDDTIIV